MCARRPLGQVRVHARRCLCVRAADGEQKVRKRREAQWSRPDQSKDASFLEKPPSWYCKSSKKKNIRKSYKCHRRVCRKYYTTTSKMNQNKKAVIKSRQRSPQNALNVGCQSAEWRWRVFLSKHLHSSPTGKAKQKYLRTRVLFSHPSQFFFFTYVFFSFSDCADCWHTWMII